MPELIVTAASASRGSAMTNPRRGIWRICAWLLLGCLASGSGWAAAPTLGSPAPAFKLQDQAGKWHELADYRGKWVVLYFYPKDQTPGCTTEACEFRDNVPAFREAGAVILGISVDDAESHRKFADKHGLSFPLLADVTKQTAQRYGVLKTFIGGLELARRETFVVDPEGRVVKRYVDVEPKGHSKQVLGDLRELQKSKR